jgi:hypothetical protein
MTLRRAYHRRFGHHTRFHLAVVLTILVVAWVAVPPVTRFVDSMSGYNPAVYEPKDLERQSWAERPGAQTILSRFDWSDLLRVGLFLFVAVLWLTLMPERAARRRR